MPTKQEIIQMMENHLPGEPVNVANDRLPPVYPVLQPPSLAHDQPPTAPRDNGIYTVVQAPISKLREYFQNFVYEVFFFGRSPTGPIWRPTPSGLLPIVQNTIIDPCGISKYHDDPHHCRHSVLYNVRRGFEFRILFWRF